jgi:hypothetical protein
MSMRYNETGSIHKLNLAVFTLVGKSLNCISDLWFPDVAKFSYYDSELRRVFVCYDALLEFHNALLCNLEKEPLVKLSFKEAMTKDGTDFTSDLVKLGPIWFPDLLGHTCINNSLLVRPWTDEGYGDFISPTPILGRRRLAA